MILITGANGFVGQAVMRQLRQVAGVEVRGYRGRITDPLALREQLREVDVVLHLASAERRGQPGRLRNIDVNGTDALLKAAEIRQVGRIVYLSRLNADPYSHFPVLAAKGAAERLIRRSTVPHTIVRSAAAFGPGDDLTEVILRHARRTWPFLWLPGRGRLALQPLWVQDLARILSHVVQRDDLDGRVVEVAGEERLRYADVAYLVLEAAAMRRRPLPVPILFMHVAAFFQRIRRRPWLTRFFVHRFSTPEVLALDSVARQFGFRPARMVDRLAYLRPQGRIRILR